jgi:hypothetical protein
VKINRHTKEIGQDLAEFALIIPIFLVFMLVILDLGRATYYYSVVHNAAREGARTGIVRPPAAFACEGDYDPLLIIDSARSKATGLEEGQMTITIICPDERTIQVTVSYPFQAVTPFIGNLISSNPFPITSQSTMRIER